MSDAATSTGHAEHEAHAEGGHVPYFKARTGIKNWLVTLDHKRLGVLYLVSVLFFFLVAGIFALLLRTELLTAGPGPVADTGAKFNQLFTLHGAIMVFLVIIPSVPAALGNFVLPLMLGAKDVAFPRLNLASYYFYVAGSIFFIAVLLGQGLDTGWTFYAPYSTSSPTAAILALTGAFILGFSSIFTGINFMVTIHKMRAPGMTWMKMPLFCWGIYATAIMQVLATPVLAITLMLAMLERWLGIGIFDASRGGDPVLFQHFFWFYSHPAVYIMIVPGFAIISDMVTVHSKKHIFGYAAIALSSVAIAGISFIVWGHHMFASTQSAYANMVFSFITFAVAVPTAIKVFSWVATLYGGKITFNTPMCYTLNFLFLFTIGGLTGLPLAVLSVDIHMHDTYFVVAHFHYVMMGGTIIAFIGGIHHWWSKMTGRRYNETLGRIGCLLVFIGFNTTFFSQFILGSHGMPRRYWQYVVDAQPALQDLFHKWHVVSSIGSYILASGLFLTAAYLVHSLFWGERETRKNPWGAKSLEWETDTPPIEHNFHEQPVCTHGPYEFDEIDYSRAKGGH
jgi:cytochrome c oxidase subunit 1